MKEKKKNIFFDMSSFSEPTDINERAEIKYLEAELRKRIISGNFSVKKVKLIKSGRYFGELSVIKNLPAFYEIVIEHITGNHKEIITVWSPLKWNDRFMGTAGGGTATGGKQYITKPDNTSRGMTLPKAIINGFTAATTDAGNHERIWAPDKKENKTDKERIENWRSASTHFMTIIGKAVAEILHKRPVRFSYLHGGSGGGRQCMVEVQEHPDDYNGIWASCPAINWSKFVLCGLWPVAVMNDEKHILLPEKIKFLTKAAQESNKKTSFFETTDRLNDETKEIFKEIVRNDALDRVFIATDYFDASINRISAWVTGMRNVQKALLFAVLEPTKKMKELQDNNELTELMVLSEEMKTAPFGAVWCEYLKRESKKENYIADIKEYEREVLLKR